MLEKIILGVDPGSHFTGFGVVKFDGRLVQHLSHGVISLPVRLSFNQRVAILAGEIELLLQRLQPDIAVVEKIFLGKNADSAFKLGHTRGVIIAAAMKAGCEVVEYATRSVKKGVTGSGAASKEQVQMLLFAALGLKSPSQNLDASDALALAFYHARHLDSQGARLSAYVGASVGASRSASPGTSLGAKENESGLQKPRRDLRTKPGRDL